MTTAEIVWNSLGYGGQAVFSARFLLQWIASERKKASVVPPAFWYLSILGSAMVLAYGVWKREGVIILGQSTGSIIYIRNLILLSRRRSEALPEVEESFS